MRERKERCSPSSEFSLVVRGSGFRSGVISAFRHPDRVNMTALMERRSGRGVEKRGAGEPGETESCHHSRVCHNRHQSAAPLHPRAQQHARQHKCHSLPVGDVGLVVPVLPALQRVHVCVHSGLATGHRTRHGETRGSGTAGERRICWGRLGRGGALTGGPDR